MSESICTADNLRECVDMKIKKVERSVLLSLHVASVLLEESYG